jgi:hypothetical protein
MRTAVVLAVVVSMLACSEGDGALLYPDVKIPADLAAPDRADVSPADVFDASAPDAPDAPDATDATDAPEAVDIVDAGCRVGSCGAGRYCDERAGACATGCEGDEGCAGAAGDGGAPPRRCDTATHACVECVRDEHCPAGFLCVGALCVAGCSSARACPAGQSCCGGGCVEPQSNVAHCGGCGTVCSVANAAPACLNGVCGVGRCEAPFADCDRSPANGCEADTQRDVAHCGGCGMRCDARPGTRTTCEGGRCVYACAPGLADCDGDAANGCEVALATTLAHCGACGRRCDPPNATPRCEAGACAVASCGSGFGDCDGNATNGCEVALDGAAAHCGACGNACPARANAFPGCVSGRCLSSCVTGYVDCDGRDDTGCEVDTRTDLGSCGGCGRRCAPANAEGACGGGRCAVARCNAGFADCDGDPGNGCEVDLATSASHCGACGRGCPSGLCRDAACVTFGGAFERADPGCAECHNGNPASGACACPGGFGVSTALRVINDCRGLGTQHGGVITTCGGPAPGAWGGAYQVDDAVRCGSGCRAANPYTGGCACPAGYTPVTFRALADSGCGIIGSSLTWCLANSGPGPRFGGAYQVDDAVPGGVGCRAANPYTGGCACPAGYGASPLRVEVDSSRGFIGSSVFQCVR